MELRDYFEIIKKRKWIILFVSVCVIAGYSLFFFTQTPSFTAQSRILLRLPPEWQDMPVISMPSWQTRVSLIESQPVLNNTSEQLAEQGLDISPAQISSGLSLEAQENTDFVDVAYTGNDPDHAIKVVNALTQVYLKYDRENNQESLSSAEETIQQEVESTSKRLRTLETRLSNAQEIRDLSRQFRNHREKLNGLKTDYGDSHPRVQSLTKKVVNLENKLRTANKKYFPDRYSAEKPVDLLLMQEANLRELNRRVQNVSTRVNEMKHSLDEVQFNKSLLSRSATMISNAESTSKSFTTTYKTYGFVILTGIILGISMGSFLEYINDKIVSKFDVHRYLGLPVLGTIPDVEEEELNLLENPMKTPLSERYHAISVVLEYSLLKKQDHKVILVTSSVRGEGKSYTSLNLGTALAREGEQVLLVDMDLRAPRLHKIFGLMNSRGVSTAISGELELEHTLEGNDQSESSVSWEALDGIIEESPQPGLDVLPAGPLPSNPIQNLKSQYMEDLFQQARNHYGLVIIDSPPLNSVIDSLVLSTLVDGVLMVIHSGGVRRGEAQHAKHLMEDVDVPILGTVLNQATQELPAYYSYYDQPRSNSRSTS